MSQGQFAFFHRLGEKEFQNFCNALFTEIFGFPVLPGGLGPDGGRDARYNGPIFIPGTKTELIGSWNFQVKFHHIDSLPKREWSKTIISDLKYELKKLQKIQQLDFDSYLFITNVEITWVRDKGSYDKIENELKPKFHALGIKNFEIIDGNKLRSLLVLAPKTVKYFDAISNETESVDRRTIEIPTLETPLHSALRKLTVYRIITLGGPKKKS